MEHAYWQQPGKTLSDGLKFVIFDRHAKEMADASKLVKNLVLYVDHVHLLKTQETERKKRNTGSDDVVAREGSGSDTDLFDSDYDMKDNEQDSDDDDFQNAVDDDVEDEMIKQELKEGVWADALAEDEELQVPMDEDGYKIKFHTKSFNAETDMENPQFKLKMVFSSMVEVRKALAQYSVKQRVQIKKTRNNAIRLEAHCVGKCAEGVCPWKFVVSKDNRTEGACKFTGNLWCLMSKTNASLLCSRMILEAREVCIYSMFEKIKCIVQSRIHTKKKEASEKWKGKFA
jgi:hypothetical protein